MSLRRRILSNPGNTTPGVGYLDFSINGATSTDTASIKLVSENSTLTINLEYSYDHVTWETMEFVATDGAESESLSITGTGHLYLRGTNSRFGTGLTSYIHFSIDSEKLVNCTGSIMTLISYASAVTTISNTNCFGHLFYNCDKLRTAPSLPATTLANYCYEYMFCGCSSLISCPSLSATVLKRNCYADMFAGCSSITTTATMPASISANGLAECFYSMYANCTSLTTANIDWINTISSAGTRMFNNMFAKCSSLTNSGISVTSINVVNGSYCCCAMFSKCTGLTTMLDLPSTNLGDHCYADMFEGCTSLSTSGKSLPATTIPSGAYSSMFKNCTSITLPPTMPDKFGTSTYSPFNSTGILTFSQITNGWHFSEMFSGCTSLTRTLSLIKVGTTTIPRRCCYRMYYGCTNLQDASCGFPTAPATANGTSISWGANGAFETDEYSFNSMFYNCSNLVNLPEYLPSAHVDSCAYESMFEKCSKITSSPIFTLDAFNGTGCCRNMFNGCTSLTHCFSCAISVSSAPSYCFAYMFYGCTSLITSPQVTINATGSNSYLRMFYNCKKMDTLRVAFNATTAATSCYDNMFYGCAMLGASNTSIDISLTTLASRCCYGMFEGCTIFSHAVRLPALTLVSGCYSRMFYNCKALDHILAFFTTTPGTSYTQNWVYSVKSGGTFTKNGSAAWNVTGVNGIPTSWTVLQAAP